MTRLSAALAIGSLVCSGGALAFEPHEVHVGRHTAFTPVRSNVIQHEALVRSTTHPSSPHVTTASAVHASFKPTPQAKPAEHVVRVQGTRR
jgi:hypothetical protein